MQQKLKRASKAISENTIIDAIEDLVKVAASDMDMESRLLLLDRIKGILSDDGRISNAGSEAY